MCCVLCIVEGFYLPPSLSQLHLHPPLAPPTAPSSSTPPQKVSRDGGRDRHYRGERERERDKERERSREEQRPHSVVDLTQDGRSEEDRRVRSSGQEQERERERDTERDVWSFPSHHQKSHSQPSTGEARFRHSPPRPSFSSGGGAARFHGPETDRGGPDEEGASQPHHNHNSNNCHSDIQRRNDSASASTGTLHITYAHPPALQPSPVSPSHSTLREPIREQRVSAPTYVPSVEVYDERTGPIQIASQARDNKHGDKHKDRERERDRHRERESYRFPERSSTEHPRLSHSGDSGNQREEGSVICSNGSIYKRGQDTSQPASQSRFSPDARDNKHPLRLGVERVGAEPKWNTISPLANYATSHMAVLAAQHGHTLSSAHSQQARTQMSPSPHTAHRLSSNTHSTHSHSPQAHTPQHGQGHTGEEGSQRRYLDPPALYRPGGSTGGERSRGAGSDLKEVSAMQSLIKYSGNFAAEAPGSSRHATDNRGPFGGLGNIVSETEKVREREKERERERDRDRDRLSVGTAASGALRVPPQLKREQERPDSSRSFSREGEGEVRHPPVGIAVAVARQRDSGSTSKQSSGPPDTPRNLLQTSIKGKHVFNLN